MYKCITLGYLSFCPLPRIPLRNAFLRFTPKCIEQKVSTKSNASTVQVAGPNFSLSLRLFSSINLLKHFCVEAESDVADLTIVQLMELAIGKFSIAAILLIFSNSLEISSIILIALPSGNSLMHTTTSLPITPPNFL